MTCQPWIDGAQVAECCTAEDCDSPGLFDQAAEIASELLYQYSARQFPGLCTRTVRPPNPTICGCPWQVLSRGHIVWNPNFYWNNYGYWGSWWCNGSTFGCRPVSRVLLAGFVQEILEVVIDGAIVDPDTYRVDYHRWLTRVEPVETDEWPHWPGCQNMLLPETEEGTWAVTYTYGREAPVSGQDAAIELACEIFKQCNSQRCALPVNTTRLARLGIVMEKPAFISYAFEKGGGSIPRGWKTGMPKVDAFLNAFNPAGLIRQPIVWTPTSYLRYAPELGLDTVGS